MTELIVIIPSLGRRDCIFNIIDQLKDFAASKSDINMRVVISFNPKPSFGLNVAHPLTGQILPNFHVDAILQDTYLQNSEAHLLHLLQWFIAKPHPTDGYLWFLTDNDPLLAAGMAAMIELIQQEQPDVLFMNNVWGDSDGEMISALAFPMHAQVWTGPAKDLFCSLGFAHAVTDIGVFVLRVGFLTPEIVGLFQATFEREEVCSHAWWLFEASSQGRIYLHSVPVHVNKMNPHHIDLDPTWREGTDRRKLPWRHPWIFGYLNHLIFYLETGLLTDQDLRTATISEPQRGILLFLDEIVRQLFVQASVALNDNKERFQREEINLLKNIFFKIFPTRRALIDALCIVVEVGDENYASRRSAYEAAHNIWRHEKEHGQFSYLFVSSTKGYHIYEHRNGFVAVLQKDRVDLGYREIDPLDFKPYILYGSTLSIVRQKIDECCSEIRFASIIWEHYSYLTVMLRENHEKRIGPLELQKTPFKLIPAWIEFKLAELLCTLGLRSIGEKLWNHATQRVAAFSVSLFSSPSKL